MTNLKRILQNFEALCLTLVMILSIVFSSVANVYATTSKEIHIKNFFDLVTFAVQTWDENYDGSVGKTVYLDADIDLTNQDLALVDALKKKHLTIGTKGHPFRGTFDGQYHRITNLEYNEKILVDANGGLFFGVEDGTIKNLIIDSADINSAFQGGLIAGYAKNALFQNITVLNSDFRIDTVNNVLSLITNAGFTGGAIVGSAEDSTLYNCEISGTYVHNNVTNGVSALGGEGMYMGGLVGWASNSTIEYCRARSNYVDEADGRGIRQSHIKNKYDIAVGALGGKSLYTGGIVGGVNNGTNIIDCFSTAEVEFYAANYVAVGSGIAGYGGGITGALRGNSTIERCHYAGDIHSYQYNAIAVIPIIQHNAHIAGINYLWKDTSEIKNSYFRPSDIKSGASISAVHKETNTDSYGAKDDDTYQDINFWESKGYDFKGTIERPNITESARPKPEFDGMTHNNKWVMDYDLGIPVHGNAVGITFDFPDAGKALIGKTRLVETSVGTDNPYSFAIQGINPTEKPNMIFEMKLSPGYRLTGWYNKDNVLLSKRSVQNIKELLDITENHDNNVVNASENPTTMKVKDNQLFVAAVEGQVTYHNVDGTEVGSDWHRFQTPLTEKTPSDAPLGAKFYGWTTIPKVENGVNIGYASITSTELNDIKQKNELYHNGNPVMKKMNLYPIYVDSKANIITEFEGHEQDNIDDNTKRSGVGHTIVDSDANGIFINVKGEGTDGVFPDGYKFKGWYKQIPNGNIANEVCVSRDPKYYVPELTEKVTYVARFEYAVEYWAKSYYQNHGNDFTESKRFTTVWYNYNEEFQEILGPAFGQETIYGWGKEHIDHGTNFNGVCEMKFTNADKIVVPMKVYSHNAYVKDGVAENYSCFADTDFPNSGTLSASKKTVTQFTFNYIPDKGYHYNFWTLEREGNGNQWIYKGNPFTTNMLSNAKNYYARAMAYADVNFYKKDGTLAATVNRRYDDNLLLTQDKSFTYHYPHLHVNQVVDSTSFDDKTNKINTNFTSEASPSVNDMTVDGYAFLGWISSADVLKDSYEWNYIYDVIDDHYCTSDVEKVLPYLVTHTAKVYETQDLYPVYAKYNVETTNNILELSNLPEDVNKPPKPEFTIIPEIDNNGRAKVKITAEHDCTPVLSSESNGSKYKIDTINCEHDGIKENLEIIPNGVNEYVINDFPIMAGKHYKFIANYSPLLVVYHLDDKGTSKTVVRNSGEQLGALLEPDYTNITDIDNSCFVGWTQVKPSEKSVHKYNSKSDFTTAGLTDNSILSKNYVVKQNMSLYPIFINPSINVNSNIDTIITESGKNPANYRTLIRKGTAMELHAKEYPGYMFTGWYTQYDPNTNIGKEVTKNPNHKLKTPDLYVNQTYTAVYKKSLTVKYHDIDGKVIHTVNVEKGTRSFVEKIKDESGIPIPNKEYMIDGEANIALTSKLTAGQELQEWQWKNGNTMIPWKDFKDTKIIQDMDIYPYILQMSAKDSNGQPYVSIDFNIVEEKEINHNANQGIYTLTGLFTKAYNQPELTLNMKVLGWDPAHNIKKESPVDNMCTRMYTTNSNQTVVEASDGPIKTDASGNALHEFFGKIILTKQYKNVSEDITGQCVYIEITDSNHTRRVIPIEIKTNNGKVEGTAIVNLPVGTYTLVEDNKWSWRDTVSYLENYTNIVINIGDQKNIVITNKRNNNKWFDGNTHKKNVFNKIFR